MEKSSPVNRNEELQGLKLFYSESVQLSFDWCGREGDGNGEVDLRMRVVMEEADIVANQGDCLEGGICLNSDHGDWVVKDHDVKGMDCIQGKAVQVNRDGRGGGSHGQRVFGRQLKHDFPIYSGNNPK